MVRGKLFLFRLAELDAVGAGLPFSSRRGGLRVVIQLLWSLPLGLVSVVVLWRGLAAWTPPRFRRLESSQVRDGDGVVL